MSKGDYGQSNIRSSERNEQPPHDRTRFGRQRTRTR